MFTSIPLGGIFLVMGVTNTFGDYTELNIYPIASWAKLCDGSQILDEDSPMYLNYVPDLTTNIVPIGSPAAGTYTPQRGVGSGIYALGEWQTHETISNIENQLTTKYFQRIK